MHTFMVKQGRAIYARTRKKNCKVTYYETTRFASRLSQTRKVILVHVCKFLAGPERICTITVPSCNSRLYYKVINNQPFPYNFKNHSKKESPNSNLLFLWSTQKMPMRWYCNESLSCKYILIIGVGDHKAKQNLYGKVIDQ